jgi:exopolysaccharide production protein ExoY
VHDEVPRYGDHIRYYLSARPGLTGLWQVSGRSDTSYDYRVNLDVNYVENWHLGKDIMIMVKTIPAVLEARGAR